MLYACRTPAFDFISQMWILPSDPEIASSMASSGQNLALKTWPYHKRIPVSRHPTHLHIHTITYQFKVSARYHAGSIIGRVPHLDKLVCATSSNTIGHHGIDIKCAHSTIMSLEGKDSFATCTIGNHTNIIVLHHTILHGKIKVGGVVWIPNNRFDITLNRPTGHVIGRSCIQNTNWLVVTTRHKCSCLDRIPCDGLNLVIVMAVWLYTCRVVQIPKLDSGVCRGWKQKVSMHVVSLYILLPLLLNWNSYLCCLFHERSITASTW